MVEHKFINSTLLLLLPNQSFQPNPVQKEEVMKDGMFNAFHILRIVSNNRNNQEKEFGNHYTYINK